METMILLDSFCRWLQKDLVSNNLSKKNESIDQKPSSLPQKEKAFFDLLVLSRGVWPQLTVIY
jgi:hypothetical protein